MKINNVLWGIGLAVLSACAGGKSTQPFERIDADKELAYCDAQLHRALDSLRKGDTIDYTMEPRNIYPGESAWNCRKTTKEEWTAGFWPGVLWYDYEATGNDSIRKEAERFTESLGFLATIPAYDHDLGFLVYCSYGNGYRLTQNPEYKEANISLVLLYNKEKKFEEAIKLLSSLITKYPDDNDILMARANTEFEMKHYDLALADLENIEETNSSNPDIYILRGNIYREKELYKEAISEYEKAIYLGVSRELLKENIESCKKNK